MHARSLSPPRARPRERVVLVLFTPSSTNPRRAVSWAAKSLCQRALFSARPGRSCPAAARVFLIFPAQPPKPEIDRVGAEGMVHPRAQLGQRGVRLFEEKFLQTLLSLIGEQRLASSQTRPGLQRAALAKLLAHSTRRRDAKVRKLRDLQGAPTAFVEFQDALTNRNRYGLHGTICHVFPFP